MIPESLKCLIRRYNTKCVLFAVCMCIFLLTAHDYFSFGPLTTYIYSKHIEFSIAQREYAMLVKIKKHLSIAHRYSRSGTSMIEIKNAYSLVNKLIQKEEDKLIREPQYLTLNSNSKNTSVMLDVCPEYYKYGDRDYPLFNRGFYPVVCNKKPFDSVISFVIMSPNCTVARNTIEGINNVYSKMEVVIGISGGENCDSLVTSHSSSFKKLVVKSRVSNDGSSWKHLIKEASNKYVLVGRDMYTFDNQSNIERLVRIISTTGIDAVGGAQRYEDGRWWSGCYQVAMKNYTLRLVDGYDMSYKSCMYCDYLSTSFVSLRDTLLQKLSSKMSDRALFMDYFLQLFQPDRIGAMACPDVMFSIDYNDLNDEPRKMWQQIAINWELNRIVLPNNKDISFTCEEVSMKCMKNGGEVVPLCCLKELSDALIFLMETCRNNSIDCEISDGGLMGAMKFYSTLPWERDEDIDFRSLHTDKIDKLMPTFNKHGYTLAVEYMTKYKKDLKRCSQNGVVNCNYYAMRMKNWRIEMWGGGWMMFDRRGNYRVPTRILFNGVWMNAYTNPALNLRGRYGDDVLQHIEHWMTIGEKHSFSKYSIINRGRYLPCKRKNFHGCLSNYLPEGSIQFKEVWI